MNVLEDLQEGIYASERLWNRKPKEIIFSVTAYTALCTAFDMYCSSAYENSGLGLRAVRDATAKKIIMGIPYSIADNLPYNAILFKDRYGCICNTKTLLHMLNMDFMRSKAIHPAKNKGKDNG